MLRHAFRNLNLHRVELSVLQTNDRAIRFYEKLGFNYEGKKRKARFKQGQYVDLLLYSMLESEYTEDWQPR
jgi:RimJ/RimL family protein N-acetyltransferase